jgi:AhpD family alkylhydroperoxidase
MKLDEQMMRLIAVGASVAANCQPCLQTNAARARQCGADEQEIAMAIEIGRKVRKGAASKMDEFAQGLKQADAPFAGLSDEGCGCGKEVSHVS